MGRDPLTGTISVVPRDPLGLARNIKFEDGISSIPEAAQAITGAGATITLPTAGFSKEITSNAANTGAIIAPGSYDGQFLTIFNSSAAANTVTMATAATSNVADGVSCVLAGLKATLFQWDAGAARWFKFGGGT